MKKLITLGVMALLCLFFTKALSSQSFKFKSEKEVVTTFNGISKYGLVLGIEGRYRKFISEKFAIQASLGYSRGREYRYDLGMYSVGVHGIVFKNESHNGLYYKAGMNSIYQNSNYYGKELRTNMEIGLGY